VADLERTIKVLLSGDSGDLNKVLLNSGKDFDKFSSNIQNATAPLADFGKKVALTEAALVSMVAYGLVKAVQASSDFQAEFLEITTLIDDTGESVDQFRGQILDYAGDSVKSIDDINGAVYSAISAGIDYKDSLDVLGAAEKLSVAGKADLKDSLISVASTMNAYGASAEEAAQYSDYLFTTVKLGQTTLPELNQSLAQVTNIAAAAGVGFDEVSAAIAAITATGAPTAEAITYIKGAITSILKPSSEAATYAKELGINFSAQALASKGLAGVLDEVKTATGGNTEAMAELFGNVRGLNAALTLTGKGSDKFKESLEAMGNSTGAVAVAFEKMQEDIKLQLQNLSNNFDLLLIGSGTKIEAGAAGIIESFSGIFKTLAGEVDKGTFDDIFDAFNAFFGDIDGLLKNVAENLPEALEGVDFSKLIQSFKNLGGEIGDALDALFGGELDLSTVDGLEKAVQKIIDLFTGLTNFTAGFIEGLRPMFVVIGEVAEKFGEMDEAGQAMAGNVSGWATNINVLFGSLDSIKNALWAVAGVLGGNLIAGPIAAIGAAATGSIGAVGVGVMGLVVAIDELYKKSLSVIGLDYRSVWDNLKGLGESLGNIWDIVTGKRDWNTGELKLNINTKDSIEKLLAVQSAGDDLAANFFDVGQDIEKSLKQGLEPLSDVIDLPPIEINLNVDTSDVPTIYSGVDKDGNIYFTDTPTGAEFKHIPVDISPTINDEKAEEAVDKTKTYIEEIKVKAETIQTAMEWKAKVDIAQVEADAEVMKTAFVSVDNTISNTTGLIGDLLDVWTGANTSFHQKWAIESMLEDEMEMRKKAFDLQKKLTAANLEMMEAKRMALESGNGLLTINIDDSVTPAIKMVLHEILALMQVEMNEYAQEYLLAAG